MFDNIYLAKGFIMITIFSVAFATTLTLLGVAYAVRRAPRTACAHNKK